MLNDELALLYAMFVTKILMITALTIFPWISMNNINNTDEECTPVKS